MKIDVSRAVDVGTSVLASTLMGWRGSFGSRTVEQPAQFLRLYDREGCASCRMVRQAVTELNLDILVLPIPMGGDRFLPQLRELSGSDQVPYLVDPNTDTQIGGSDQIVEYLFQHYANKPSPANLVATDSSLFRSRMATIVRGSRGLEVAPSKPAHKHLTLFSFESSPYSRLVRERLCELELQYLLINIGKQQRADVGPANFRLHLGSYKPLPNTKRSQFYAEHGNVQVPYLLDPNTGADLFESADILDYLNVTYGALD